MIVEENVESLRERDGGRGDRPEYINDVVYTEKHGWKEGEPLVGDSYSDYPNNREALAKPQYSDFIQELLEHNLVRTVDDAVSELCGATSDSLLKNWRMSLTKAASWSDIDIESALDKGDGRPDNPLESILGRRPHPDIVDPSNPLLVSRLYSEGLSTEEISIVLSDELEESVKETEISDTLKAVGLLGGKTTEEAREAFRENDGKLGNSFTVTHKEGSVTAETR